MNLAGCYKIAGQAETKCGLQSYLPGHLKQPNIEIIKNAGHSMAWENPKGLAEAISNGIRTNL
ncbi:hypothetical protein [Paenibacillus ihuae]|uniref:hypothetical protein n=1 Tax=Paenibacillus ihuae TaxID=1232431 RepID=UPI00131B2841|nr:hypothetical protein [Paenibacillus ihuae]